MEALGIIRNIGGNKPRSVHRNVFKKLAVRELDTIGSRIPIDATGTVRTFQDIPEHREKLIDDPYRSLAGYVRNAGGYEKTAAAFAEFLWADFFRPRVPVGDTRPQFHASVNTAAKVALSPDAAHLPGYRGPDASPAN